MIDPLPSSYPQVKSGRLKALAVTSAKRVSFMPDVPTVAESGIRGFEMVSWYGLWGPRGVPKAITAKLSTEAAKAARAPLAISRLGDQGFEPGLPVSFQALPTRPVALSRGTHRRHLIGGQRQQPGAPAFGIAQHGRRVQRLAVRAAAAWLATAPPMGHYRATHQPRQPRRLSISHHPCLCV